MADSSRYERFTQCLQIIYDNVNFDDPNSLKYSDDEVMAALSQLDLDNLSFEGDEAKYFTVITMIVLLCKHMSKHGDGYIKKVLAAREKVI